MYPHRAALYSIKKQGLSHLHAVGITECKNKHSLYNYMFMMNLAM